MGFKTISDLPLVEFLETNMRMLVEDESKPKQINVSNLSANLRINTFTIRPIMQETSCNDMGIGEINLFYFSLYNLASCTIRTPSEGRFLVLDLTNKEISLKGNMETIKTISQNNNLHVCIIRID